MVALSRFCFSFRSFLSRFLRSLSSLSEATPVPAFLIKLNIVAVQEGLHLKTEWGCLWQCNGTRGTLVLRAMKREVIDRYMTVCVIGVPLQITYVDMGGMIKMLVGLIKS